MDSQQDSWKRKNIYYGTPFKVPCLMVYPQLRLNYNDTEPIISMLNFLHLWFFSVHCSNLLSYTESLNGISLNLEIFSVGVPMKYASSILTL